MSPLPRPVNGLLQLLRRKPLLTVCIPTFNGAATIEQTLARVLSQAGVKLEVVVADDASTDDTIAVIRKFNDHRIRLHGYNNQVGIVPNWNRALAAARGRYVIMMGQDDLVDPQWAESLVSMLEVNPKAGLAFCRRRFSYDSPESEAAVGEFFSTRYPAMLDTFFANTRQVITPEEMVREAMRHDFEINLIAEPAFVAFRRADPAARIGYDPRMFQMIDWEFYTRFFIDRPILHCPRTLGTYCLRSKGVSVDNARNHHRHDQEYDYLLGLVLDRFDHLLTDGQKETLGRRRLAAREKPQ